MAKKKPAAAASTAGSRQLRSAPTSPLRQGATSTNLVVPLPPVYPVYLRPEQNIPEIFGERSSKFTPICLATAAAADDDEDSDGGARKSYEVNSRISRDDIVVTVRSAKV